MQACPQATVPTPGRLLSDCALCSNRDPWKAFRCMLATHVPFVPIILQILFDGIPLDRMSVSMTMNGAVLPVREPTAQAAKCLRLCLARSSPASQLPMRSSAVVC